MLVKARLAELLLPLELARFRAQHLCECLTAAPAYNWSTALLERARQLHQQTTIAVKELTAEFKRQQTLGGRLTVFYCGRRPLHVKMAARTEAFELVHPSLSDADLFLANRVVRALVVNHGSTGRLRRWLIRADLATMQKALRASPFLEDITGARVAELMLLLQSQARHPEHFIVSTHIRGQPGVVEHRKPPGQILTRWVDQLEAAHVAECRIKALPNPLVEISSSSV